MNHIRVLLVEDDADDYALTRDFLAEIAGTKFRLDWLTTYDGALAAMQQQQHDVYLLDYRLGERNGLELLRAAVGVGIRAPMILLTGQGDHAVDMEAMEAGAADYLIKEQLGAALLERAMRYAMAHKRTEEELERRVAARTGELAEANRVLEAEIAVRRRAEEQLKGSLREKEVLLREIHHRVKNNLQVISSLLNLQAQYVSDPQAKAAFKESQGRVRSMALIHQKLYQAKDLGRIHFAEHVDALVASLSRSYGVDPAAITLTTAVADVVLGIDTVIPCSLIIHELVTNALKHAFADGRTGAIRIALQPVPDQRYQLIVQDDGVGLPKDLDYRNGPSLGVQIVNALTDQLDGALEFTNGKGTTIAVTFRDVKYKERG